MSTIKKINLSTVYSTSPGAEKILTRSKDTWIASPGRHLIMLEMQPGCSLSKLILGPAGLGHIRILAGSGELLDNLKGMISRGEMSINVLPDLMKKLTVVVPKTQVGVFVAVPEPGAFVKAKVFNQFNRFINNSASDFRLLVRFKSRHLHALTCSCLFAGA